MNRLSRALIGVALSALATMAGAQERPSTHIVPLFPAASDTGPHGVVRIVNLSDEPGAIDIVAIGADGARYEGASLAIGASETAHFDSDDLESGNPRYRPHRQHRPRPGRLASGTDERPRP